MASLSTSSPHHSAYSFSPRARSSSSSSIIAYGICHISDCATTISGILLDIIHAVYRPGVKVLGVVTHKFSHVFGVGSLFGFVNVVLSHISSSLWDLNRAEMSVCR